MARWILLTISVTKRGIEVAAADSDGKSYPASERLDAGSFEARPMGWLQQMWLRFVPERPGVWVAVGWAAPGATIFVRAPAGMERYNWEAFVRLLPEYQQAYAPVARYVTPAQGLRQPFELPLKVMSVGRVEGALERFRRHGWVQETMGLGGLEIGHAGRFAGLERELGKGDLDVVICGDGSVERVLEIVGGAPMAERPGLVMSVGAEAEAWHPVEVPRGTVLYRMPEMGQRRMGEVVDRCLLGLLHAEPPAAMAEWSGGGGVVYCGPDTMGMRRVPEVTEQVFGVADYVTGLARAHELVRPGMFDVKSIVGNVTELLREPLEFHSERTSILPASRAVRSMRESAEELEKGLPETLTEEQREKLLASQERRVDVALRRLTPSQPEPMYVPRDSVVEFGAEYLLCVRIGQPFRESLMTSDPPPIDPLVPKRRKGNWLQVALFPKELEVKGQAVRRVLLPEFGPSKLVAFRVKIPAGLDRVEARIGIYRGNQLLQNFLFSADVKGTRTELQFSQSARFQNLEELGERAVSLTMNEDGNGTHRIMTYRDGKARDFRIPEGVMKSAMDGYREFLEQATGNDPRRPRFSTYPEANAPIPAEFHEVLSRAAKLGRKLYDRFDESVSGLTEELRFLRGAADERIQIVRMDSNYTYPWSIIYDWKLPEKFDGEFCLGTADGNPCKHKAGSGVYCVRGFWGIRHELEELIQGDGKQQDTPVELRAAKSPGAILLSADQKQSDLTELGKQLGETVSMLTAEENLLERVWDAAKRPAITIIYGHTVMEGKQSEWSADLRITLPGGKKWLTTLSINDQRRDSGELQDPRPVILLLACNTALIDVATLNSFISSFQRARAAVVLGTEWLAYRSLLARFAREMTVGLAGGSRLGSALRDFRTRLLQAGNPVPFVFHAVGSADFHLVWEEKE